MKLWDKWLGSAKFMYRKTRTFLSVLIKLFYNILVLRGNIGFIDSVEEWIDKQESRLIYNAHPKAWYKTFTNESELFNIDKRFCGRGEFRLFNEFRWCLSRDIKLYYISKAVIVGENATVMSPDGRVFKELTYPTNGAVWRYVDFFGRIFLPAVSSKAGWYTSLACPTSDNFCHWIMECLPRLAVLENYTKLLDGIIIPPSPRPFHHESLRALGIDTNCLIEASPRLHMEAEHFFTTDYCARDNLPAWLHLWYKEKFIQPLGLRVQRGRKIYISRADATRRKASNCDEIENMVSALGFEVVIPGKLTFLEQAAVFHTSDVIIGEHGAGFANLVFCRERTKVMEIFNAFWMSPCFYSLARSVGLEYHFYVAGSDLICPSVVEKMGSGPIEEVWTLLMD